LQDCPIASGQRFDSCLDFFRKLSPHFSRSTCGTAHPTADTGTAKLSGFIGRQVVSEFGGKLSGWIGKDWDGRA
jgi:hypothetical protein